MSSLCRNLHFDLCFEGKGRCRVSHVHLSQLRGPRWCLDGFCFYLSQRRVCFLTLKTSKTGDVNTGLPSSIRRCSRDTSRYLLGISGPDCEGLLLEKPDDCNFPAVPYCYPSSMIERDGSCIKFSIVDHCMRSCASVPPVASIS